MSNAPCTARRARFCARASRAHTRTRSHPTSDVAPSAADDDIDERRKRRSRRPHAATDATSASANATTAIDANPLSPPHDRLSLTPTHNHN